MKTICVLIVILCVAAPAAAQQWHTANQKTFAWDAVAGIPGDTIKYQAFYKPRGGTPVASGQEITATEATVTLPAEGRYFLCVQAVRYIPDEPEPMKSELACSDVPEFCLDAKTFGIKYFVKPDPPGRLR